MSVCGHLTTEIKDVVATLGHAVASVIEPTSSRQEITYPTVRHDHGGDNIQSKSDESDMQGRAGWVARCERGDGGRG
jgi:hypothetical protein